ncbi:MULTISPECIES: hypothetical protein [Psychrobacter]|uniref:hypothetical protein n=1 Tax=Psychrobacter TaxID=497 RepID=UPI001869B621|nr:hypothetical protein [Psychrobacter sp. FME60]
MWYCKYEQWPYFLAKRTNTHWEASMKKLSKKQSQWAWFIGLYIAGFAVIFTIAQLIKLAMGV